jgi:Leucine-rich repeat (LRR) protein
MLALVALVGGCGGKKEDGNTGVVNPNKPSPKAIPEKLITDPIVEKEIRRKLKKPTGELTVADLEKVTLLNLAGNQLTEIPKGLEKLTALTVLYLSYNKLTNMKGLEKLTQLKGLALVDNQLTDVKGLEKITKLERVLLSSNPDLTKAQIDELQKALPDCFIPHTATK